MELVGAVLALLGSVLMLLSVVGILRFPDALTRLHPGAKLGALGTGSVLAGCACTFGEAQVVGTAVVLLVLVLFANSLVGHLLARAGYFHQARPPLRLDERQERSRADEDAGER